MLPLPTDTNRPAPGSRAEDRENCSPSDDSTLRLPARPSNSPRQQPSRRTGGWRPCEAICAFQKMRLHLIEKVSALEIKYEPAGGLPFFLWRALPDADRTGRIALANSFLDREKFQFAMQIGTTR